MRRALKYGLLLLLAAPGGLAWGSSDSAINPDGSGLFFYAGGTPGAHAQGYLGVDVRDVPADQLAMLKLKDLRGAEIVLVDHDAPAGKAGLREHDVVLQMNGQAIEGEDQIRRMLRECPPGRSITLVVSRDGQQITVTTQMANREEVEKQAWEQHLTVSDPDGSAPPEVAGTDPSPNMGSSTPAIHAGNSFIGTILMNPSYTGAMLERMSTQLADYFGVPSGTGLLVRSVVANSPAALAGMHAGDVVVQADAKAVTTTNDWAKAIKNSHGRPVSVVVLRDRKQQTLTLTPDSKKRSSLTQPGDSSPGLGMSWRQKP